MPKMSVWRWVVVAIVAIACTSYMGLSISGMFSRRSDVPGTVREASAFESMLYDVPPPGAAVFDGWAYRVPARFAGRVRVLVRHDSVTVAGPRVPPGAYRAWIWAQGLLLALVPAALAWVLVWLDWRPLLVALALALASWAVSILGAAAWPTLGELPLLDRGRFSAVEFPRASVRDVSIGEGWSRGGLEVVLLPYKAGVDALAADRAVSFFAPDGSGHEVRYAIHPYSDEQAEDLASLLRGGE